LHFWCISCKKKSQKSKNANKNVTTSFLFREIPTLYAARGKTQGAYLYETKCCKGRNEFT
jgi:hypothetical protein